MYAIAGNNQQLSFFGEDILNQLDESEPLLKLASVIPWDDFEQAFKIHYSGIGAPAKPIRMMVGLLLLKQLENLSDERIVIQWKQNPYYQVFCGQTSFSLSEPCHSTELVKFRKRIQWASFQNIFIPILVQMINLRQYVKKQRLVGWQVQKVVVKFI